MQLLLVMALAPQGMGRALAPVGALPPYLPRGFFTLTHKEEEHTREKKREQREYRERNPPLRKTISLTMKKYFSN